MHLDFTISVQGVMLMLTIIGGFVRIERKLMWYNIEHEILIADYLKRNDLKAENLPTRARRYR